MIVLEDIVYLQKVPEPSEKFPVTELLREWSRGDRAALDRLLPLVYSDLHNIARRRLYAMAPGGSMQATALVNEVYLRLVDSLKVDFRDRAHFFAICATMIRQIVIDAARTRSREKRGGGWRRLELDDPEIPTADADDSLMALDEAMNRLAALDERKARVVELRFFGGLTNGEIAEVQGVSVDTVKRDWTFAKLWLAREVKSGLTA